jgi:hypothetical protein
MSASCTGQPAAHEALLVMQGSPSIVLADVSDATHPHKLCTLSGPWSPELVTQRMVSWSATQTPGQAGPSMLVTLDLFAGSTTVVANWQGGLFMDGLHSWSPDESSIAYVTSDATAVNLHLLSGGGDRSVATLGAVPGRGLNGAEDDAFLGFSADGTYFALVQTFTGSGAQLQVRRTKDGTLAYSQPTGTMATWSSTGSRLFFREPGATTIKVWDPTSGVSTLFALQQSWLHPVADAGDDNVAYTVRDSSGNPHVWIYGHGGRSGGELGNVRSSPLFLNAGSLFLIEEVPCGANCGLGAQTSPDGKTFTYNLGTQSETPSTIASALGSWPRIGQT